MLTAMLCAAAVTAQFVGGKATRDAVFLTAFSFTALPVMVIATSVFSIFLVIVNAAAARRIQPAAFIPVAFAGSGILFLIEWLLTFRLRSAAAVIIYLHISGAGPLLGSGFWLIATERFDPRTAKRRFGQIAGAGTLGGLVSALLAERIAALLGAVAMLPFLGVFHLLSAWQVRRLALESDRLVPTPLDAARRMQSVVAPSRSGWRVLASEPYLRRLALLVLLGTLSAALLDYLMKAEAVRTFGRGANLLRFFALYYAATALITFVVQISASRYMLQRFGLAAATSTPSIAAAVGGLGSLLAPGLQSIVTARAAETVCRGALFRSGYELFFTPIPSLDKRAAKSIIDVAFDRMGDAVGGGVIRLAMIFVPVALLNSTIVGLSVACSLAATLLASRLNRGYRYSLERGLVKRAVEIDLADVEDSTTRSQILETLHIPAAALPRKTRDLDVGGAAAIESLDPEMQIIVALRSRNRDRIVPILRSGDGLKPPLVPHVIPLLAWDPVSADAIFALRKVAEERIGQLTDALIDPNQDFAVRRRLARVFAVCVSQRAADGVLLGLDDLRFEVRFHCGRSLAAIIEKNPLVRIDAERIFAVVLREADVGTGVWEVRHLLDAGLDTDDNMPSSIVVRDRANQSLAHVFTLLSLVLPREPLQIAYRGLHTDDQYLRGTALEYLEGVLPPMIRQRLWPYLEDRGRPKGPSRPQAEILAELLASNKSILVNLEELKRHQSKPASVATKLS